jgi:phage-related protein
MDDDKLNIDVDELRNLDLSALLNIDLNNVIRPVLRLEDLENIDWESVTSYVLGIADPIGQLRDFLASLLSGFVDTIRNFFVSITSPIADAVNRIFSVVSGIPDALSRLADVLRSVVLDPIRNAIQFALDALGRLRDVFTSLTNAVVQAVQSIPGQVSNIINQIGNALSGLANSIMNALRNVADLVARIPDMVREGINAVARALGDLSNRIADATRGIADALMRVPSVISDVASRTAGFISDLGSRVQTVIAELVNRLAQVSGMISDLVNRAGTAVGDMLSRARDLIGEVVNRLAQIPAVIGDIINRVASAVGDLASRIQGVFVDVVNRVQQSFGVVFNQLQQAGSVVGDFINRARDTITNAFSVIIQQMQNIPNVIRQLIEQASNAFSSFVNAVRNSFTWLIDQIRQIPNLLINAVNTFVDWVKQAFETIRGGVTWLSDQIRQLPGLFNNIINQIIGGAETAAGTVLRAFQTVGNWIQNATTVLHQVAGALMGFVNTLLRLPEELWKALPKEITDVVQTIYDFFTKVLPEMWKKLENEWNEFTKDPGAWLYNKLVGPIYDGLKTVGDVIARGARVVLEIIRDVVWKTIDLTTSFINTVAKAVAYIVEPHSPSIFGVFTLFVPVASKALGSVWDALTKAFDGWLRGTWVGTAKTVEDILQQGFERAEGIGNQMWWIGGQLLIPYWQSTVATYILRGLARAFSNFTVKIEPQVAGTKMVGWSFTINLGELFSSIAETLPSYAHAFAMGSSFAIAQLYLQNIQAWYAPRVIEYYDKIKDKLIKPIADRIGAPNAIYNAFVRIPSEREMMEWARRWIATLKAMQYVEEIREVRITVPGETIPRDVVNVLDTIKLHLTYFGLPKWYVEFNAQDPDKFYIAFEDRFGAIRKVPLSPLYELPTHSELARMTQRDIFPSVRTMQAVTWIRGWNEDISTMMYLLTFKYPSFEKLWEFYMRATAGMLWFSPPSYAKSIFESEAEQVKAGKPISPLDIQNALASRGAHAMQAFETALNLYLKWLEYSNFSWITPNTKLQGVNVGQIIHSALGGWTADSWLMWDVAADIPTKIDMRWMSRYGIFQHMASRIGEQQFASYTPLVKVVQNLLDSSPESKLTVELQWFSKLLQATGLHPAWVPIVTVAENIMVISDEMTLLRTGWINLFKEGLLTFDVMDQALSGLFTVSYKVGYWNPETKQWTTGWINLPIRWLPHERRLLEYRALIDRIMDLYREFYGYLRSAVRSMILTPDEAKQTLSDFVKLLDAHYSGIARQITGYDVHLKHDVEYLDVWLNMFAQLGKFEAMERARMWWNRVSGWLLYRIAQGYVDVDKVVQMLQKLKDILKLTDIEMNAYLTIVNAIYDIVGKERIPTPWQMATLAEYMSVPDDLIKLSIDAYEVDERYRNFLYRYIKLRPIKLDYRELIIDAIRALRAGRITKEVLDQIVERARAFGFTDPEIAILKMRGEFLSMVYEDVASRSVRVPTPWQLATLAEYMSIPQTLVAKSIAEYGLDPDFAEFVARYIALKPLKADYRQVITSALRALRYGAITRDAFDNILKNALNYGFTEPELALIQMRTELDLAVDSAREYVPTPSMLAAMAEYLPEVRDYIADVFRARRISGDWAELWAKYIYLRPITDEVKRWLSAIVALVERHILPMDALKDVLNVLSTYGYEQLEQEIIMHTVLSNRARRAWNELLGTARNLVTMSRYSDAAADMAWTRVVKIVDALPVDNQTKDLIKTMWKQYITHYQNYPEIRTYVTELVTSYAYGVIDDTTFERELQYLKQLGVPEMTLALIRRRAQLRRLRIVSTRRQRG